MTAPTHRAYPPAQPWLITHTLLQPPPPPVSQSIHMAPQGGTPVTRSTSRSMGGNGGEWGKQGKM